MGIAHLLDVLIAVRGPHQGPRYDRYELRQIRLLHLKSDLCNIIAPKKSAHQIYVLLVQGVRL